MKRLILVCLFSCFSLCAAAAPTVAESAPQIVANNISTTTQANITQPQLVNRIVAQVNKRVITKNELEAQIKQAKINLAQRGVSTTNQADLKVQVLNQMIMQQIQLDLAARSGIKTTDTEVNNALANIEKTQNLTDDQMRANLQKQGINIEDFRRQLRDQITTEKLKQREVDARITVNDDEVNRILNSESYKDRVDFRLSYIIIGLPEQATQEVIVQKQALANQIDDQLKSGSASFEQMAIKYSTAPNALTGGDLGWKSSSTLPPMVADQLSKLPINGISPVIRFPVGFFIFKVTGLKKHGTPQMVKQYHVRHILIKVNELMGDDEAHQKIIALRKQIVQYANNPEQESKEFVTLAKQSSEDASSINGGDIGWVSKGDTVPPFEQMMLNTPLQQISEPVRTPFGWHILEVLAVRESNLANEKEKAEIRQELRESKGQMLYTEWLRNIREMSYVDIKMNND